MADNLLPVEQPAFSLMGAPIPKTNAVEQSQTSLMGTPMPVASQQHQNDGPFARLPELNNNPSGAGISGDPFQQNQSVAVPGSTVTGVNNSNGVGIDGKSYEQNQTYGLTGVENSGAFLPGNHQINNPLGGLAWPVSFESVSYNPFSTQQTQIGARPGGTQGLYGSGT